MRSRTSHTTPTPQPAAVLDPTSPTDLARAQTRLAAQVRGAFDLSPDAVVIIARSQATLARTAEVPLRGADPALSSFAPARPGSDRHRTQRPAGLPGSKPTWEPAGHAALDRATATG